ncbi:hypothetical protein BJY01DRAFT_227993 [Aspergillus pseudoustus]|uniref:HNH nuclease domain-containing protein n=1 Tax=Aspergillus pseudoustus TaxID=1810923 RepID=A0ABR4INH0_9EURO
MAPRPMDKSKNRHSRWKPKSNPDRNRTRTRNHKWGLVLRKAEGSARGNSLLPADAPPTIPTILPEGRKLDVHLAAVESRSHNSWLKDYEYSLNRLKTVQCTWQVQLTGFPDIGYAFRIYLLWDYDRLWGLFKLGHSHGAMLVDPGPRLSSSNDDPQNLAFTWRGGSANDAETHVCDPSIAKGEIWLNPCDQGMGGYFDYIAKNGMIGGAGDRCYFRAKPIYGPAVVPYDLNEVIDEWEDYDSSNATEDIRQGLPLDDLDAELDWRDRRNPASAVPTFQRGRTSVVRSG